MDRPGAACSRVESVDSRATGRGTLLVPVFSSDRAGRLGGSVRGMESFPSALVSLGFPLLDDPDPCNYLQPDHLPFADSGFASRSCDAASIWGAGVTSGKRDDAGFASSTGGGGL